MENRKRRERYDALRRRLRVLPVGASTAVKGSGEVIIVRDVTEVDYAGGSTPCGGCLMRDDAKSGGAAVCRFFTACNGCDRPDGRSVIFV